MSSKADLVLENIYWRVESIDPSHSGQGFRPIDPAKLTPEQLADGERLFWVDWVDEELPEDGVSDIYERIAPHRFELRVIYSACDLQKRQKKALQDRHDIIKALRDTTLFVGYEAGNASADTGLIARWVRRVERTDETEGADTMVYSLECTIQETET